MSDPVPWTFEIVPLTTLHPHEEVVGSHVDDVLHALKKLRTLPAPVVADRRTGVILDGHHRYAALKRLGCSRAAVAFVDYSDPRIKVESWRAGETPPTKDEVVKAALQGKLFPPKTTRHRALHTLDTWAGSDGTSKRSATPLSDLR